MPLDIYNNNDDNSNNWIDWNRHSEDNDNDNSNTDNDNDNNTTDDNTDKNNDYIDIQYTYNKYIFAIHIESPSNVQDTCMASASSIVTWLS